MCPSPAATLGGYVSPGPPWYPHAAAGFNLLELSAADRIGAFTVAVQACIDEAQDICGKHGSHGTVTPLVLRPCSTGVAVPTPTTNASLMADCEALLESKLILEGSGTALNWSVDTTITSWHGVTVSGTPSRVTGLDLADHGITGGAAAALADLKSLQTLRLGTGLTAGCLSGQLFSVIVVREITTDLDLTQGLCEKPGRPQNLASTATTAHSVSLSWDAPTGGGTVAGYRIRRKTVPGDLVTIVYDTGSTATSYVDRVLKPGTSYRYRVHALNVVGDTGDMSKPPLDVDTDP